MKTSRDKQLLQSKWLYLDSIMPLTHLLSQTDKFITVLSGDFSFPVESVETKTFEFRSNGKILIICHVPEALIKLSFTLSVENELSNNIKFYQGSNLLHESKVITTHNCELYIRVLEGSNPIDCKLTNSSAASAAILFTFNKRCPLSQLA